MSADETPGTAQLYSIAIAGATGTPNTCDVYGESAAPLPLWRFEGQHKDDLTGAVKGLWTVVGCAAVPTNRGASGPKQSNRGGALWVVKCICGVYSRRRTKSLKNGKPDACRECSGG